MILCAILCGISAAPHAARAQSEEDVVIAPGRDPDVRPPLAILRVSADGTRISFRAGGGAYTFSLRERILHTGEDWSLPLATPAAPGKIRVVAMADGTVRWFGATDGVELAAYLLHQDRRRWIAWTRAGYYDASVGGEDLLGFVVPRKDGRSPDFFRIGLLREQLHRPLIVANSLGDGSGRSIERRAAPLRWPAVVRILSPVDGATLREAAVTICVAVRARSDEEQRLHVHLVSSTQTRGVVVTSSKSGDCGASASEVVLSQRIDVPPEDVTIRVSARSESSQSEPVVIHLRWAGIRTAAAAPRSGLNVLAVGVSSYQHGEIKQLRYAAKDALDLRDALLSLRGHPYRSVDARVITDARAGHAQVLAGLDWLRGRSRPQDVSVIFLAGHGINDEDGRYYFLPHDAAPGQADPATNPTLISGERLQTALREVQGRLLFFIDTCHSGSLRGPARGDLSRLRNELLSSTNDLVLYAAAGPGQSSLERESWNNGAFTKALIEGLRGDADFRERGRTTVTDLEGFLAERVGKLTHGEQVPTTTKVMAADFVLAEHGRRRALHRRWWFWGGLGLGIAAATVLVVVPALYAPPEIQVN